MVLLSGIHCMYIWLGEQDMSPKNVILTKVCHQYKMFSKVFLVIQTYWYSLVELSRKEV